MSLNSLSNETLVRPVERVPLEGREAPAAEPAPAVREGRASQAFEALTQFIPTELLAPYVAALSLAEANNWGSQFIYLVFIIATPITFLLFHYAKLALDEKPWPVRTDLPLLFWRAVAAMTAFAIWGLSVPTNPLQAQIGGPEVAGFFAVIISPILTAVDAILKRVFIR